MGLYIIFHILKWSVGKIREIRILKRMAKSGIRYIDKMDGFQFEVYLKALFRELGYRPEVTKRSCDYGVDVILKGRNRIVIQAKRYGIKNRVGIRAVQEVYAGKAYYKADEAWIVTNSVFTKQAEELAKACQVKLIDRFELQNLITKVNPEQKAKDVYQQVNPAERKCPVCKNQLVIRYSKKNDNKFFGCSQFPSCTHTEAVNK
ncbi:restriction endonuclease [Bacillus pseudomycoides]|uniref:Restriction endonuclease n=3 Tax=Bacillaceae TaxID=186817 RepID=A0AAJ2DQ81_9BACI|nr:restriction endonuclease [Bacillus pseudomycoides]EEM13562.1 5-methylcytosine-specific restriction enzyme MRR [Bacillus pseudomycoides DSM 12442]MCR8860977.1 restriction endonuclease [Bacillus pseudomycoides]MDR4329308.1 restriction endonuclease [Bacillus pseudomycoides]MED1534532.1 restriction endonuclease [Bacillus pseudomycoides]MED1599573.1 restriction endonuclease [Bacillus pseudomycoides]